MFVHVLRNAINPLITALGYAFASLLSGALLVENVMNYPGLGQLIFDALIRRSIRGHGGGLGGCLLTRHG